MSNSAQQPTFQQPTFEQHLVGSITEIDSKVDNLAKTIKEMEMGENVKQVLEMQMAGLRHQIQQGALGTKGRSKAKKVKPFDGKSQPLRSFLTAIELEMEDEGIVEDEAKVKYVGRYLRDDAWEWFEPIIRERNEVNREDWSPRAKRILTSYSEMKKAMKQALGDIDERKTAAQELQKLRQTRSVREYITKFQQITSRLDWDDEAMADKFLEGLKPKIQELLIYFPEEPKNLEELFGRAQKIDREHWNRQEQGFRFRTNTINRRNPIRRDRDGDIQMIGAKVDLEKAKKEGLCFKCGKPGHQAKRCRQGKRQDNPRQFTARMVHLEQLPEREYPRNDETKIERVNLRKERPEVLATFEGSDSEDFDSDSSQTDEFEEHDSEEEESNEWKRLKTEQWKKHVKLVENNAIIQNRPRTRRRKESLGYRARKFGEIGRAHV